jgi:hypothetical protein
MVCRAPSSPTILTSKRRSAPDEISYVVMPRIWRTSRFDTIVTVTNARKLHARTLLSYVALRSSCGTSDGGSRLRNIGCRCTKLGTLRRGKIPRWVLGPVCARRLARAEFFAIAEAAATTAVETARWPGAAKAAFLFIRFAGQDS